MKIALVTDWFSPRVGGIEIHVRDLAVRLRERGHDAVVLTPWPGPPEVANVPVERIPVSMLPGAGVSLSPKLVGHFSDAFAGGGYDLLHAHVSIGSFAVIASGYAGHLAGLPTIGTFHSVLGRWRHAYALAAPVLGWRRWAFRVTAVSEVVATDLRRLMPDRPVDILPPAIDTDAWRNLAPLPAPGTLRLVTTARLHSRKRLDALLTILADVRQRVGTGPVVTLDVLGGGPHRGKLAKQTQRLGLDDSVHFLGPGGEEDVRTLLGGGDLFVNACDQESFGLAALEALSGGLPVLARSEGGIRSFVDHGRNGLLVDTDAAMADALVELAREPARLHRLRAGAAQGIPAEYHWNEVVDRHLDLYADVVGRPAVACDVGRSHDA